MATVFRLATKDQTSTYDFLTGNLKPQNMTRTPNGDGWMTTSMTLVSRATEALTTAAATYIGSFAYFAERFWGDPHEIRSPWLEESSENETTKRSLIQSIELVPLQTGWMSPLLQHTGAFYTLTIIHSATWENTTQASVSGSNTSLSGGLISYPEIDGSIPGRFSWLIFTGDVSSTTDDIVTIWGGIRPYYVGNSDFHALLELETGTLAGGAALASDSDLGSPAGTTDNVITYTSTTDDVKIDYMTLDNAISTTDFTHWIGDYQVLLRAKVSTGTIRLHIDNGYYGGSIFNGGPYIYSSSTDYTLLEMGTISIPPFARGSQTNPYLNTFEFQLYAMAVSGTPVLTADCLILIPAKHYFKITNAALPNSAAANIYIYRNEDDTNSAQNLDTGGDVNLAIQYAENNLVYPIEGGTLVLAGQEATKHRLVDEVYVRFYYYERFRTHGA